MSEVPSESPAAEAFRLIADNVITSLDDPTESRMSNHAAAFADSEFSDN